MRSIRRFFTISLSNIVGLLELLLLIRIILRSLSANPGVFIVRWIYTVTDILLVPMQGIFANAVFRFGVVDVVAITGMILYLIAFAIIYKVIVLIFGD